MEQRYTTVHSNESPSDADIAMGLGLMDSPPVKRDPSAKYHPRNYFSSTSPSKNVVDVRSQRYPYCIVWSPLPLITWLCPVIGHMGICDSQGIIWDFAGPYTINHDDMAFGSPTRYLQLDPSLIKAALEGGAKETGEATQIWDNCVHHSNCHYSKRMHNICCQNCHHHTARALGQMKYRGISHWSQITLAFWIFFRAPFTSVWGFLYTFGPFSVILAIILYTQY
jgi:hypothetical protein